MSVSVLASPSRAPYLPLTHLLPSTLQGALEKHEPACFVVCRDAAQAALLEQHAQTVLVLARSSKAPPPASLTLVAAAAVPRGCVSEPVSSSTEVHVLLKGVIDFAKEVTLTLALTLALTLTPTPTLTLTLTLTLSLTLSRCSACRRSRRPCRPTWRSLRPR